MSIWNQLVMAGGVGMFLLAAGMLTHESRCERQVSGKGAVHAAATEGMETAGHWRPAVALTMLAWAPVFIAIAMLALSGA